MKFEMKKFGMRELEAEKKMGMVGADLRSWVEANVDLEACLRVNRKLWRDDAAYGDAVTDEWCRMVEG